MFVAVRPATFYQSRQAGTLAAYTHKVLTISPPRADRVVEKRLKFALKLCEGEISLEKLEGIRFNLSSMATFLKALIFSLENMDDLREFLSNITGGNIRSIVELVTKFIGSPNVDADKIIRIMEENGEYYVPVHEFWKEAMLGQYAHYHSDTSLALNIYEIMECDERAHFLIPMILGYLDFDGAHKDKDGFVSTQAIIREIQNWGFAQLQIESALRRLNNKKLTDTVQRVTFDEDVRRLYGPMPESFRLNTVGA